MMTLLEGAVRQRLSEQKRELAGLFAGTPKRRTSQPTTERLLEAWSRGDVDHRSCSWLHPTADHASFASSAADFDPTRHVSCSLFPTD